MIEDGDLADFAPSVGALTAFGVAAGMVGLRGMLRPEVTAVALAGIVALSTRYGGRTAGLVTALMSALCFDFFHTEPYLSLKIGDPSDVVVAILLLGVGLDVGGTRR